MYILNNAVYTLHIVHCTLYSLCIRNIKIFTFKPMFHNTATATKAVNYLIIPR